MSNSDVPVALRHLMSMHTPTDVTRHDSDNFKYFVYEVSPFAHAIDGQLRSLISQHTQPLVISDHQRSEWGNAAVIVRAVPEVDADPARCVAVNVGTVYVEGILIRTHGGDAVDHYLDMLLCAYQRRAGLEIFDSAADLSDEHEDPEFERSELSVVLAFECVDSRRTQRVLKSIDVCVQRQGERRVKYALTESGFFCAASKTPTPESPGMALHILGEAVAHSPALRSQVEALWRTAEPEVVRAFEAANPSLELAM